ncbi:NUDIX domain-containing protein [Chitinophaga skermanii]|uniref:NUDIX domain-containing protein n=1 Tax=Chitinophaga skermanii TaxID=331697 RepID=A0A327QXM4_9BACT|nr:NUDIX domain-containing protein [Chitinophaga skermanii]RAJ08715.1 NUDIX domain-containing protein [Chitinophaga skermanii]
MQIEQLYTAGLIAVKDKKLLLAFSNNKNAWYLPGGKIDPSEPASLALQREIEEELNVQLDPSQLTYYCHITAPAYGEEGHIIMEQSCFLYNIEGEIRPSNEIGAVQYFDLATYLQEPAQVIGVLKVFELLKNDQLL